MQDSNLRRATCNAEVETGSIRLETHDGRDHLVAPVVAVREMVLKGEFLKDEEIADSLPAWNGRVLPIGHPTDDDGEFVSANTPDVHGQQVVGQFYEADQADDGSLVGEVWVDVEKSKRLAAETTDDRFVKPLAVLASHADGVDAANMLEELPPALNAAANADPDDILEVSTAYFYRRKDAMGTHNGEKYDATQHNIRPDHLALLPNSKGECSAEDGCGAPRVHVHANVEANGAGDAGGSNEDHGFGPTPDGEQTAVTNFATMSDEIEWLASHTAFDRETLENWEDDHLRTLRKSVEHGHDGDCQCGAGNADDGQAQNDTNDGDGDGGSDGDPTVPDALQEDLSELRSEVEELREQRNAEEKERAAEAAKRIAAHAEQFEDTEDVFDALGEDPERLAMLADEFETKAAAASADFGGRVGATSSPGGGDEDASDYKELAKKANESRFGTPEADD